MRRRRASQAFFFRRGSRPGDTTRCGGEVGNVLQVGQIANLNQSCFQQHAGVDAVTNSHQRLVDQADNSKHRLQPPAGSQLFQFAME